MRKIESMGMAALCAVVGVLAGLAAALGIFMRGDGSFVTVTSARGVTYEMATSGVYAYNAQRIVAEGIGWDAFTLFVAVPAMLLAALFVARGSFRGRLFALGLFGYLFYQYLEYAVAWAFGPLFLLFILVYAMSLGGIVWLGVSVGREGLQGRFTDRFPGRPFAILVAALAVLLSLMWFQRIGLALNDFAGAGLTETTMVVQAFDLGLVVPLSLFVAVLAWRGGAVGRVIAAVYVVAAVSMAGAIFAMVFSAGLVEGTFEAPPLVIFGGFAVISAGLGVLMYRSAVPGPPAQQPLVPGTAVSAARA